MSYLYKKTELPDKTILEMKIKNYCIFILIVFLSLIPAAYIVDNYFSDKVNFIRIPYVSLVIIVHLILGGRPLLKILSTINNKTREGSMFSLKNPAKYIIKK